MRLKPLFTGILPLFLIIVVSHGSCKKSESDILEANFKLSQKAKVNKELQDLRNSLESSKDDFEKALIFQNISSIESEKGNIRESIKAANESLKYYPNQARGRYLLGREYLTSGRYDEARSELETAIAVDPRQGPAHFELGNIHYKKKDFSSARREYELALSIDPSDYQAHNNLGVIAMLTGDVIKAEQSFKKVIALNPDFASGYKNLGILNDLKLNNKKRAKEYYGLYLKHRPNAPDRAAVTLWISKLGG